MGQGCKEPTSSDSKRQEDQGWGRQKQVEKEAYSSDDDDDDSNDGNNGIATACWDDKPKLFEEIYRPSSSSVLESLPDEVEAYIAIIEPKLCKSLLKELGSFLPLIKVEDKMKLLAKKKEEEKNSKPKLIDGCDSASKSDSNEHDYDDCDNIIPLGHLRRVRRSVVETQDEVASSQSTCSSNNYGDRGRDTGAAIETPSQVPLSSSPCIEPPMKRSRQNKKNKGTNSHNTNIRLEVLVGAVVYIDQLLLLSKENENKASNEEFDDDTDKDNNNYFHSCNDNYKSMRNHRLRSKAMKLKTVISTYNLQLLKKMLPGRPAKSQAELDQWNNSSGYSKNKNKNNNDNETTNDDSNCQITGPWWPTLYFNKKSDEFKIKEQEISRKEEYCIMKKGMLSAIKDAQEYYKCMVVDRFTHNGVNNNNDDSYRKNRELDCCNGAAIMCPNTERIISTSSDEIFALIEENCSRDDDRKTGPLNENEMLEKQKIIKELLHENPLNTPVLFAIQGVSRKERLAAMDLGMDNDSFKNNQYLCTGYDIYLTKEPSVFEAMALVHARIRRVVFLQSSVDGGIGSGGDNNSIHSLPSINHRYRAFRCIRDDFNEEPTCLGE